MSERLIVVKLYVEAEKWGKKEQDVRLRRLIEELRSKVSMPDANVIYANACTPWAIPPKD